MSNPLSGRASIAAASVGVVLVGGLVVAGVVSHSGGSSHPQSTTSPLAVDRTIAAPRVTVDRMRHGKLPWHGSVHVSVKHGTIQRVLMRSTAATAPISLTGAVDESKTEWHSSADRLQPATTYLAHIFVADAAGHDHVITDHFRTKRAKHWMTGIMSPNEETVGVGQPITIHFDSPVPARLEATVERHLTVTTSPEVAGAWHWFDDEDIHWRPQHYWKTGTKVHATMDLSSIYFGHGRWGQTGLHTIGFRIGDALISKASVPKHIMKVYDNGKLVRTIPISAGDAQYPTMGGIHVTLSKSPTVIMDSATIGIPKGSPGYYYETVLWDVRISDSGSFVHAAPWSLADQGNTNVSHGCLNASPENAEWFYHFSHKEGDIVDIYNPVRGPSATDPGTEDWNMSWKQWLAGDALAGHDGSNHAVTQASRHNERSFD